MNNIYTYHEFSYSKCIKCLRKELEKIKVLNFDYIIVYSNDELSNIISSILIIKEILKHKTILINEDKCREQIYNGLNIEFTNQMPKEIALNSTSNIANDNILAKQNNNGLESKHISLNEKTHTINIDGKTQKLKGKEYELFKYFINHKDEIHSKTKLLEKVWDINAVITTNTVETYISKLRKTIKKISSTEIIETIHGYGYKLNINDGI